MHEKLKFHVQRLVLCIIFISTMYNISIIISIITYNYTCIFTYNYTCIITYNYTFIIISTMYYFILSTQVD